MYDDIYKQSLIDWKIDFTAIKCLGGFGISSFSSSIAFPASSCAYHGSQYVADYLLNK